MEFTSVPPAVREEQSSANKHDSGYRDTSRMSDSKSHDIAGVQEKLRAKSQDKLFVEDARKVPEGRMKRNFRSIIRTPVKSKAASRPGEEIAAPVVAKRGRPPKKARRK